jgi:prophage regulatory protein
MDTQNAAPGSTLDAPHPQKRKAYSPSADLVQPRDLPLVVGLSPTKIWRLRRAGQFPPAIKLSIGRITWRKADLETWLTERQAASR